MDVPAVKIKVRWSDLDANMHLANSAYVNFASFARTESWGRYGLNINEMNNQGIGPIIFHENFSYFKEVRPHDVIYVTAEVTGLSETADLFEFTHNYYNPEGKNICKSYMLGTWIDFKTRKRATLPDHWINALKNNCSPGCKKLTLDELKKLPHRPMDIDPKILNFIPID